MLAKRYKLPIQDFVGRRGRLVRNGSFSVKIFPSSAKATEGKPAYSRFGVTISTKVAKKATKRNKLRRLVYNSIKEYYSRVPLADYWITILPSATKSSKERLVEELCKLLNLTS